MKNLYHPLIIFRLWGIWMLLCIGAATPVHADVVPSILLINDTATYLGSPSSGGNNVWYASWFPNSSCWYQYYRSDGLASGAYIYFTPPQDCNQNGTGGGAFGWQYWPCGYGGTNPVASGSSGGTIMLSSLIQSMPGYSTSACEMNTLTNFSYASTPLLDKNDGAKRCELGTCCGGMPVWSVSEPYVSLWLDDEPLGYQPALGPRVSFTISYKQRESTSGLDPTVFGFGKKWNCPWLSYVSKDSNGSNVVLYPGGGERTYYGSNLDFLTNTRLTGDTTNGFQLAYPDGSTNVFGFIVTNSGGEFLKACLTETCNPQGQYLRLIYDGYSSGAPVVRLRYIVDGDNLTNTLSYVASNGFSTNLVTRVTDPFGRYATLLYDNSGNLTNITDVMGLSSSLIYDTNSWVTKLTTPYGPTLFNITDPTNGLPSGRSVLVTEPDGGQELFLNQNYALGVGNSYPATDVPNVSTFQTYFDNMARPIDNTFHWGRRQYAALSTTNIASFTANDFRKARLRHWLMFGTNELSQILGLERLPSPDTSGNNTGQATWYDYPGKTNLMYAGTQSLPLFEAQVLPDGSTRFTRTDRNNVGAMTHEISTYSTSTGIGLRTNTFTYAANGVDVVAVTNALNVQVSSNAFNSYHQIVTNCDALNQLTTYQYNGNHQLAAATLASGLVITNSYFSSGAASNHLSTSVAYALVGGAPVYYRTNSYSWANDLILAFTDPMGLTITNSWDNLQRLRRVDFPDRTFITNAFSNLDLVQAVDRLGYSNSFGYDSVRRLVAATNANGLVTRYGYCICGALNSVTNAFGTSLQNVTTFAWDLQGHMLQSIGPDLYTLTYNFNALGQLTNVYDGLASVMNWYNNQGLVVASSNAVGQVSAAVYDILDRATNAVDANTVTVTNTFDNLNRLLTRGYPDGGVEHYLYTLNVAGVTSYTNQLGTNVVNFTYDPLGRKTTEVYPGITTNSFGYDGANHLLTLTDGNNHTTSWTFDLYGRMLTKADATGTVILTNAYDPDNRLTNRWTVAKTNTIFSYDPAGNLTAVQYPVSHGINYYYDLLNRMTNMVDAAGSSTYSYTVAGQLAVEDGPWADDAVNYTYSTTTRLRTGLSLLQPNSSAWAQSYSYDSAERLQSITSPAGSFGYSFDPVRQAMANSLSLPNAAYITNYFDSVARLLGTVLKNSTNGVLNSHQYAYNLAGQRTYLTNTAGDYRNYIYDNAGQLTGAHGTESGGGGRWNEQFGYKYDPAGNLASRTNNDLTQTFAVNSLNELSAVSRTANMTVIGTTTSTATNVTVNALTALLYADTTFARTNISLANGSNSFVAVAQDVLGRKDTNSVTSYLPATNQFSYDGNGNLLSDGNRNFAYDDENQLTSVWVTNGWRSDFVYDGKMRRRIRHEYTWFCGAWLQTNEVHYIYDGNLVIQERDANNVPTLSYTRGRDLSGGLQGAGGIGGLLAMSQGSGASLQHSFYHADGNGNITALINGKQAIVARYLYDPFGNILSKAGPLADANAYRFSSKELHTSSGLLYYGYRFYDPIQQRWLNRDPLAESGGLNLYAAFGNNPVASVDFDGRFAGAPVGFALLSETTVSSSTAITIGGSGATTVIVGGSGATVTATTGLTSGGTATTGLSLLSEVLAPFTYALAGGYLLGELAEVSRDAERNPTGVNGPPGQASAPLLPGYTLQGDEYRDPTTGDIYSLSKGLVRDKFGRPMGAVGVDCPDKKAAMTGGNVGKMADDVLEWLGPDSTMSKPPGGSDLVLRSADGTKQIRFDLTNPHGLDPHVNVETFEPRNLFPGDRKMIQTGNDHVFPKP